jgi:putative Mn2+ efflux pump MntP
MVRLGGVLFVVGLGSFVLPLIGYQFTLISLFDDYQPWVGIIVAVLGIALVLLGMRRQQEKSAGSQNTSV